MLEELRKLSDESYNPMSYIIRQALSEYLEKNKKINGLEEP
jgi:metal-responsive CopG/Arc/MetJ family transcriptional regulator